MTMPTNSQAPRLFWFYRLAGLAAVGGAVYLGRNGSGGLMGLFGGEQSTRWPTTWVWDWIGGGWNFALASSKAEATRIAVEMGKPNIGRGGGMTVTLTPTNVRIAQPGEIDQLASGWD